MVEAYVEPGVARIIFWPVLNHGDPSVYSTLASECVGQQSVDAFWDMHEYLFANQQDLWSADRDYYINAAVSVAGVDQAAFTACYDSTAALDQVLELDALRRSREIYSQPVFDVNGQLFYGSQPFSTFSSVIESALP